MSTRLKKRDIRQLFVSLKETLQAIKEDIIKIKNVEIPENIKIRIKKLEVEIMGVEEQLVNLEDRMRAIELDIVRIDTEIITAKNYIDNQIATIDTKLITAKEQFNIALQDLDDKKEDKAIIIPEEIEP